MTFYHFNTYLSGACALFAALAAWILQFLHATHFSRPAEQAKIIRIIHIIPTYSLISWFCIFFPQSYYYLAPWLDLVQAICLATFFLLLCEFISSNEDQRSLFFAAIDIKSKRNKKAASGRETFDSPEKKLMWYRRKWIAIFQYPIIAAGVSIVTTITLSIGHYCANSFSPHFAHLYMFILSNISVTGAVTAILMLYQAIKIHLKHHLPLAKLGAFKLIVGLGFLEGILFAILQDANVLKPTATLTYADIKVGIPTMLICIQMVPISLFFHFAYSHRPYCLDGKHTPVPLKESKLAAPTPISSYQGGFLGFRAILMAADPREVFQAFFFAFRMATELRQHEVQMQSSSYDQALEPLRPGPNNPYQPTHYNRGDAIEYTEEPHYQQSQYAQPGYGQTGYSQTDHGRTGYGQMGNGHPIEYGRSPNHRDA